MIFQDKNKKVAIRVERVLQVEKEDAHIIVKDIRGQDENKIKPALRIITLDGVTKITYIEHKDREADYKTLVHKMEGTDCVK